MSVSKGQPMRPAEVALLEICDKFANPPYFDKSGEVVVTDDAANVPLLSLTVHGKSVQDGEPTPDNPVEIQTVSGTPVVMCNGRNILKPTLYNANIYSLDGDVFYNLGASTWGWSYSNSAVAFTLEPGTYTVSGFAVNGRWNSASALMRLYSADGTVIVNASLNGKTEVNETFAIEVQTTIGIAVKNYPNTIGIKFQLEYGSTATPYEPYQESTATIDLQGHELAGLPDGTSDSAVVSRLDVIEGMQNVYKRTFDGTERFGITSNSQGKVCIVWQKQNYPNTFYDNTVNSRVNCLSDYFFPENFYYADASHAIGSMCVNSAGQMLFTLSNEYDTVTKITEFMTGKTVYYRLATPVTYQLPSITPPTPIDGGTMRVVANVTPEIDVRYIAKGIRGGILMLQNCADDLESLDERVTQLEQELED